MIECPVFDLVGVTSGPTVAVGTVTITRLKELLILALELEIQNYPMDARALLDKPFDRPQLRAVEVRIMRQFAWFDEAGVEALTRIAIWVAVRIQEVAAITRQRDECGALAVQDVRRRAYQSGVSEVLEIAPMWIQFAAGVVAQVGCGDDTESAHGRQCSELRSSQLECSTTQIVNLAAAAMRHGDIARKGLTWVARGGVSCVIRRTTSTIGIGSFLFERWPSVIPDVPVPAFISGVIARVEIAVHEASIDVGWGRGC